MAKQVFDLREGKGMSAGQSTEHLRNYSVMDPDAKKFGYYDPTRVNLNFEVGRGGVIKPVNKHYSIVQRFKDNLRRRGIEDPNEIKRKKGLEPNRNTVANIILGGSRDQMHKLAFGDQQIDLAKGADNRHIIRHPEIEKWAQDMYNYVARRFGEENIIAFVVHLDEKNPHVHCTLVPVNEKNKISYHDVFGHDKEEARKTFLSLHNEVAEINKQYGLERGTDINTTGARHRTSEEYWQWLKDRCGEMENNLQGKKEELDFLNKEYRRTDIKVKGLSKMLENMKVSRNDIQEEIRQLEEDVREGRSNSDEIRQQIQQLNKELEEVDKKMKDKKEKLDQASQQLEMILDQKADAQHKYDDLQRAINREQQALNEMSSTRIIEESQAQGWREFATEAQQRFGNIDDYRQSLSYEERKHFDKIYDDLIGGTILEDAAERGAEIIAVTAALYMGSIEQAMSFAQSRGGGGSSPGTGWGRKPDEDDEAFRGRCFLMARMMMRPPGRKLKR
jgi:hypothetical protein